MYIIILLFQGAYSQCFQKQKETSIYLSSNETLKLDLQDYIYGKQLKYHSSKGCINEKLDVRNITLSITETASYSGATLCYDPVTGRQYEQSIQFQVKDKQLTVMYFNMTSKDPFYKIKITIDKVSNKVYQNVKCENIICLKLNESLIDCHSLQQYQTKFYLFNATNQKYQNFTVNNTDYGKILQILFYFRPEKQNNQTYIFYRLLNDRIDKYQLNITSQKLTQSIYIDRYSFNLTTLTLFSFTIYNNGIYLLSKEQGLCFIKQNTNITYCWDFNDQFNLFSVFVQSNGQHSIILGSTIQQNQQVYKALLTEDSATITSFYKLRDNANLIQIFHNQQYTVLIGSDKKKVFAEIYSHMNDFTSNLYKVIESLQNIGEDQFFYYDSLQDRAISINNKSILVATVQTSYLTINDKECYCEQFVINATQQGVDSFCEITFNINLLEEGSEDIYDIQEMNQTVVVLNKSLNTFDLNNYVIGPNINYYLYQPYQGSEDDDNQQIQFKETYQINYNQTIDISNIQYNKAFTSQGESNFDYYQFIQWNNNPEAEIYRCKINDTTKLISCFAYQSLLIENQIQQILTGFQCLSGCFVIRSATKVILYMEINQIFTKTSCELANENEIDSISYIDGNYIVILQNNVIQIFKGHFQRNQCSLENVFQTDSVELQQLVNVTNLEIFYVRTNNYMYILYISTNVGLIVIDPGLHRFNQIQLLWFIKYNEQFDTVLQIINNKVVRLNYNQIKIIHLVWQGGQYYQEKILPIYNYTITNTTNSKVGLECNFLYIYARDSNKNDKIIVYKLDQSQISSFHTAFPKVNKLDFDVISKKSQEFFLIQVSSISKLYANVQLNFISSNSKKIKILFEGFLNYAKMMDLNVDVKTSEKQYDLQLINNDTKEIRYKNPTEKYIKLDGYNDFIEGSVSEWDIKCDSCSEDLQLINNVNFNSYLTSIPNATQIKHTYDYVLIQQEQNILAIDGKGKPKYFIQLPIPDSQTKCTSITASVQNLKTRLAVSVCNSTQKASFYITSFLSSLPTPIGPFYSPILIHQITHVRLMNDLLFILDVVTEYVYIFNLTIQNLNTDYLTIVEQLDARAFTADLNQVFVSFDVAYQDESYIMWLVTNTSQLVLFTFPNEQAYTKDLPTVLYQQGFTDLPSNIIPQALLVADFGRIEDYCYYLIIIANRNYHHYEFEVSFLQNGNEVDFNVNFLRAYMQYGYYTAMGKIRVSEATEGFFGVIYENPFDDRKKMLAIYDRKNSNQEKLRKILGGFRIVSDNLILFDFLHYTKPKDEFSYGIILTDGAEINLFTLSRYLAIKVNYDQFDNQNISFNASNDFKKWVEFKVNIYNEIGPNLLFILIGLGLFVLFVFTISALYVRNKLKKMKYKMYSEIQIAEEEEKQQSQI